MNLVHPAFRHSEQGILVNEGEELGNDATYYDGNNEYENSVIVDQASVASSSAKNG